MFCIKCGNKLEDGDTFCSKCGAPVEVTSPTVNSITEPSQQTDSSTEPSILIEQENNIQIPSKTAKRKRWIIPTVVIAVILAVAGIGTFLGVRAHNERLVAEAYEEAQRTLRQADRYLDDLEYEKAIAAYEQVIEIDPKNIDAYMGLAEAYLGLGDYEKAIKILKEGEDETDDDDLRDRLDELEALWNVTATMEGVVVIADADVSYSNNEPLYGADIHLERIGSRFSADTTTDSDGYYHFDNLHLGEYDMTISSPGYTTVKQRVEIYEMQRDMFSATIEMIPESMSGDGTASGLIYDALEGFGVEGLTLNIRSGPNNLDSEILATVNTDYSGYYITPELPAGLYSVEIIDKRGCSDKYVDGMINVKILGDTNIDNQNGTVSTVLMTGQIRIVLTWGETPSDLDSHLFAELDNGNDYHTWYVFKTEYSGDYDVWEHSGYSWDENGDLIYDEYDVIDPAEYGGERLAALDLDDVDSYGPETTTIYVQDEGEYTFIVHDYSSWSSLDLAQSGAMVQIYLGNSAMPNYTFYAPQAEGYYWEVFKLNGTTGQIVPSNRMFDQLGGEYVDIDPNYFRFYSYVSTDYYYDY